MSSIRVCGECPEFNLGRPLKPGQHMGVCPYLKLSVRPYRHIEQSACARYATRTVRPILRTTLERELWHLTEAPDAIQSTCIVCGKRATNKHHVIERSAGKLIEGREIRKPVVTLCGSGTTGCHGKVHEMKLHLDYRNEWVYLETDEPVGQIAALKLKGWRKCKGIDQ